MKKLISVIFIVAATFINAAAQTNESKPIRSEDVKFYLANTEITSNECNCSGNSNKQSVIVKVKVTQEMFKYDLIQIGARYFGDNETYPIQGKTTESIQFKKSDFKNKYSVGSEMQLELPYADFCLTSTSSKSEWRKYHIEVMGAYITTYEEAYNQYSQTYEKIPVYGEYDYLTRSNGFKFMINKSEMDALRAKEDKERKEEAQKENKSKRRGTIAGIVVGAALVYFAIKAIWGG
jgi:hypothetical protein